MTTAVERLAKALIDPAGVAVVGASDDAGKTSGRPIAFLRRLEFGGAIYPVNPRRSSVQGLPAFPSVGALPGPADHAFLALPKDAAVEAAAECAAAGIPLITILAEGFAEAGAEGMALQGRLIEAVVGTGSRIIGPNSLGSVRTWNNMTLTANAAFACDALPKGSTTVLSQSGSLIGTLFSRGRSRGLGFATLISVGNEADLSVGEIGEALLLDDKTDTFVLFLETIRHASHLRHFALKAEEAGKRIIAYKLGRSEVGAQLAVSHTGALVGSDAAADQFLRESGIARVECLDTLYEAPPLFRAVPRTTRSATIVATTGGGGALVADRLGASGVEVAPASEAVRKWLADAAIRIGTGRIIDLSMAGTRYEVMRAVIDALLADPQTNVLVCAIGSSAEFFPEQTIAPIADAVAAAGDNAPPVAGLVLPNAERALTMLAEAGVAAFRTPEACADGIRAFLKPVRCRKRPAEPLPAAVAPLLAGASSSLNEHDALKVFAALGVPTAEAAVIGLKEIEKIGADGLPPFPLVAKLLSSDLPHKTEAGAVTLGIGSIEELWEAVRRMLHAASQCKPDARVESVIVQRQVTASLAEVLVGIQRDPGVGAIVTIGVGGTLAELHSDTVLRLAPVIRVEARAMIDEVKSLAIIRGYRNKPKGDCDALAEAIARISLLAQCDAVSEAEINPLLVHEKGVTAVDGLIVLEAGKDRAAT